MKTKYFFVLLIVALVAAFVVPALAGNASAKDPAQEDTALIPVTGAEVSVPARAAQEPRLWSGEILNSNSNSPDQGQSIQAPAATAAASACSSEDALERRQGGCIE
jgi:hypothetical protein